MQQQQLQQSERQQQHVIILDGATGTGKTSQAVYSFMYRDYCDQWSPFINKKEFLPSHGLYGSAVLADALLILQHHNNDVRRNGVAPSADPVVVCCSLFGMFVHDVLDQYGGHATDPAEFRRTVRVCLLEDRQTCDIIRSTWRTWMDLLGMLNPRLKISLMWAVPTNFDRAARLIAARRDGRFITFRQARDYIENQTFVI